MAETRMCKFGTILFAVFLGCSLTQKAYSVEPSWVGKRKFAGEATGVIWDVTSVGNQVFLAAENGLFQLTGNNEVHYSSHNSPLGSGYITNLVEYQDKLLLTEFGNGVFTFNLVDKSFQKITLPEKYEKKAWTILPVGENLFVSALSRIIVVSLTDNNVTITEQLADGSSLSSMYSMTLFNNEVVVAEAEHLLFLDTQGEELRALKRESDFPDISAITYVAVIDDKLYVGGVGGVYRIDENRKLFFPIVADTDSLRDVESIVKDHIGRLWVAAGGLYVLDAKELAFKELALGLPKYSYDQIRAVQAIHQLENNHIIISSTQLGLIELNQASTAMNYLHENSYPFRRDVYDVLPVGDNHFLAKTAESWLMLEADTGKLSEFAQYGLGSNLVAVGNNMLLSKHSCRLFSVQEREVLDFERVATLTDYCQFITSISYQRDKQTYLYYQRQDEAGFVTINRDKLIHQSYAPKNAKYIVSRNGMPVTLLDKDNALYTMEEQGVWIKHRSEQLKGVDIYCMYPDQQTRDIYMCTSGKGLKRFNHDSLEMTDVFPGHHVPRFIRDGHQDSAGNHWLATNIGFVLANDKYLFEFETTDGIVDTDFNYSGILPLSSQEFVLVGDQLSYLVNAEPLFKYVEERREHLSAASITAVHLRHGSLEKTVSLPREPLYMLSSAPDEIIFEFASADVVYSHLQTLEYRLSGLQDEWVHLPTNIGTVAYSGLSFGDFDFQVRVVDEKSTIAQPITSYMFSIPKPLWLSWQAYVAYVVCVMALLWLGWWLVTRHLAMKSQVLANIIEQKQTALLESNRSITDLLNKKERIFSNLATEIRTPVMLILNPILELRAGQLTSAMRAKLDLIFENASRLRALVDQLILVQRIEHISEQVSSPCNIQQTIQYIIETHKPTAMKKQQVVSFDNAIKEQVMLVQDSLETMVSNLLVNALKYSAERAHIQINVKQSAEQIVLTVRDNGAGMSPQEVDLVLSRFDQGINFAGNAEMGIGLNLVNELAIANDGWIEFTSEQNVGTTVTLYLPYRPVLDAVVVEPDVPALQLVAEQKADYVKQHLPMILLVDRHSEASEYLINILGDRFNCYAVDSGKKALELITVLQPDLIITELILPTMTGIELTAAVRELSDFADIPVMILTAQTDHASKVESFKAAVNDYLIKPVEREELLSRIESNLTYTRLAHQHAADEKEPESAEHHSSYVRQILPLCRTEKDRKFIIKLLDIIESNYARETFCRNDAASLLSVSERQLNRMMAKLLPDNFSTFLKTYRLEKSLPLLAEGKQVTQVAIDVGFGSSTYFSRCFKQQYGCLPTEMK